jgi:methylmalonyl-CoA mutase C-terminal domain/subunit
VVVELALRDSPDVVVFGGGVIPDADLQFLTESGIAMIFTPGTTLDEITSWVEQNIPSKVQ